MQELTVDDPFPWILAAAGGGGSNWQKVDLKGEGAAYTPFKAGSFSCVTSCYS